MIRTFAALNSKGGVGKTTLLANIGGLLADMGARTLLLDADPQPSLTKYFELAYEAPQGLVEVLTEGTVTHLSISRTSVTNLDLVRSNDGEAQLQHWLHGREDRRSRLAVLTQRINVTVQKALAPQRNLPAVQARLCNRANAPQILNSQSAARSSDGSTTQQATLSNHTLASRLYAAP